MHAHLELHCLHTSDGPFSSKVSYICLIDMRILSIVVGDRDPGEDPVAGNVLGNLSLAYSHNASCYISLHQYGVNPV